MTDSAGSETGRPETADRASSRMDDMVDDRPSASTVRRLVRFSLPAAGIGIVSALVLYAVEVLAHGVEHVLWSSLPDAVGADAQGGWWILGVLSVIGLLCGLVIWLMPGHGGPDSASVHLIAAPMRLSAVPSLLIVGVLALGGGVSLGPEAIVIGINVAILVAVFRWVRPSAPVELVVVITASGTIGAVFGTPVAAALVFTGLVGTIFRRGALWDQLFLPLVSASAGAVTMSLIAKPQFALDLPAYDAVAPIDIVSASGMAVVAAALGLTASGIFPRLHRAFRLLRNPAVHVTAGGVLLGLLGVVGGPITLFQGNSEMGDLVAQRDDLAAPALVLIVVVKVLALLISAAAGFRGGRIFPAVFIGAAIGILANTLIPAVPLAVAVSGGVLGMVLAISRDGWVSLFIAVALSGGVVILPVLCIAILPAWLLVSRGPEMIVHARPAPHHPDGGPHGAY